MTIQEGIKKYEEQGLINPDCKECQSYFYPQLLEGKEIYNIFAPRHQASPRCKSGKHPHCTCDTCF